VIEYCDVDDLKAEYAAEIKQVLLRHRAHLGYSESQAHSMHGHSQHSAGAASGIMRACCCYVLSACCADPQVACVTLMATWDTHITCHGHYLPWTSAVISDRSNCCECDACCEHPLGLLHHLLFSVILTRLCRVFDVCLFVSTFAAVGGIGSTVHL
jgi:hypothetical protein